LASTTTPETPPPEERPAAGEGDAGAGPRLLLVVVGGERFGCPLEAVREVVAARATARLPGAEPHVLGLMNLRGRLLTVLDVGLRLALPSAAPDGGHVLVVEVEGREAGCRVDQVLRVVPAPPLHPAAQPPGNAPAGGIVMGIGEVDGEPVAVLDLPRFVSETLLDPGER